LGLPILLLNMAEYTGRVTKLSEGLNIPKPTLSSWVSRGIIPKEAMADSSPLPACKAILDHKNARIEELEARLARQDGDALYQRKVEMLETQIEREKMLLATEQQLLLNAEEMTRSLTNIFAIFKTTLYSWAGRIPPQLVNIDDMDLIEEILLTHINEALQELVKFSDVHSRQTDIQAECLEDSGAIPTDTTTAAFTDL